MNSMSLGTWPIVGIVAGVLALGLISVKFAHKDDEEQSVASYEGGRTRRNRKGGSKRFRK